MHGLHAHLRIQRQEKNNEAINECWDRVTLRTNEMQSSQQTDELHPRDADLLPLAFPYPISVLSCIAS